MSLALQQYPFYISVCHHKRALNRMLVSPSGYINNLNNTQITSNKNTSLDTSYTCMWIMSTMSSGTWLMETPCANASKKRKGSKVPCCTHPGERPSPPHTLQWLTQAWWGREKWPCLCHTCGRKSYGAQQLSAHSGVCKCFCINSRLHFGYNLCYNYVNLR